MSNRRIEELIGQKPTEVERQKHKGVRLVTDERPEAVLRYLVWSETKGVFLGDRVWSYDDRAVEHNSAVTFNEEDAEVAITYFRERNNIHDARMIQAYPDLIYNLCSNNAVANVGLPRWEFDEKKFPILPKFLLQNLKG